MAGPTGLVRTPPGAIIRLHRPSQAPKERRISLADNPGVEIFHRGKFKSLTAEQRRWLRRRLAIDPAIGHAKSDHRMDRCWLQAAKGDALLAHGCAVGYNVPWLMRGLLAKARMTLSCLLQMVAVDSKQGLRTLRTALLRNIAVLRDDLMGRFVDPLARVVGQATA